MAWPLDTYWLCVETNFTIDTLSPNNGYPQCVVSGARPNYIRVLGPYKDELLNELTQMPVFGKEECEKANILVYNNVYPDGIKNKDNWTTRGYYAYCPFNSAEAKLVIEGRDLPPTRTQASKCVGPYYTEEEAKAATKDWNCKIIFTPAYDTCSPTVVSSPYPELECSLVCALGWPMIEGSVIVDLFQNAAPGSGKTIEPSYCIPKMSMALSCEPSFEPLISRCWNSTFVSDHYAEFKLIQNPPRGYKLRLTGTMCIDDDINYANVSITMEALMISKDADPDNPNPTEGSKWIGVASLGGRLPALGPSRDKKDFRVYSGPITPFNPSVGLYDFCFQYAKLTVQLRPWVFGCDGSAGTSGMGSKVIKTCGIGTADKAYSCASVQVLPLNNEIPDVDGIYPRPNFYQLGLNANTNVAYAGDAYETNCVYCKNTRAAYNPWECSPKVTMFPINDLLLMGIDGEADSDFQSLQLAGTYIGMVGLKRIGLDGLYLILQPSSYGGWASQVNSSSMVAINRAWRTDQWKGYILRMFVKNPDFPFDDIPVSSGITGNSENTLYISGWPAGQIPIASPTNLTKFQIAFSSGSTFMFKPILAENIIQTRQPMIIEYTLIEFNARLLFYMLEFPSLEVAGCIVPGPYPPLPPPEIPSTALLWGGTSTENPLTWGDINTEDYVLYDVPPSSSAYIDYNTLLDITPIAAPVPASLTTVKERFAKTCLYLREEIPQTGCCGSSNKYVCEKFGKCRKYGRSTDGEPVCGTCPEFTE